MCQVFFWIEAFPAAEREDMKEVDQILSQVQRKGRHTRATAAARQAD